MAEWMPIETAPKDGRLILLHGSGMDGQSEIYVGYWGCHCYGPEKDWGMWLPDGHGEPARFFAQPTHWAALPPTRDAGVMP